MLSPPDAAAAPGPTACSSLVLVGVGVVAYQGLTSASLYFYNADEAVAQTDEPRRQAHPRPGPRAGRRRATARRRRSPSPSRSTASRCRSHHERRPAGAVRAGHPGGARGRWAARGESFMSDAILVKHDEQYEADNGDRLDDAEDAETGDDATPVNATLGTAGVVLGVAASALGIVTLAVGLRQKRPQLLADGLELQPPRAAGRRRGGDRHAAGAHHARLHRGLRARQRLEPHAADCSTWRRCGPPSRARSCCGR